MGFRRMFGGSSVPLIKSNFIVAFAVRDSGNIVIKHPPTTLQTSRTVMHALFFHPCTFYLQIEFLFFLPSVRLTENIYHREIPAGIVGEIKMLMDAEMIS